jgi:hypothetical protein
MSILSDVINKWLERISFSHAVSSGNCCNRCLSIPMEVLHFPRHDYDAVEACLQFHAVCH